KSQKIAARGGTAIKRRYRGKAKTIRRRAVFRSGSYQIGEVALVATQSQVLCGVINKFNKGEKHDTPLQQHLTPNTQVSCRHNFDVTSGYHRAGCLQRRER